MFYEFLGKLIFSINSICRFCFYLVINEKVKPVFTCQNYGCDPSERFGTVPRANLSEPTMPTICTFTLNGASLSTLQCPGIGAFAAFSGMPQVRNKPGAVAHVDAGPLPLGRYYVID